MPKVNLAADKHRDEEMRRLIKMAMAREGYETQRALAKKLRCKEETLSRRLRKPDSFTRRELRQICKVLRITGEELASVII